MGNRSDDFNRADGAIGSPSDGGAAWGAGNGTWLVGSNQAYESTSAAQGTVYLDASSAVVTIQFTLAAIGGSCGPLGRYSDQNNHIVVVIENGVPRARLYKKVAGTFTQLGSTYSGSFSTSDVIVLSFDASDNIAFKQNGTSRITATDSAGSTNTKHGFRNNGDTTTRYDDFTITDDSGGGGTPVAVFYYHMTQSGGIA